MLAKQLNSDRLTATRRKGNPAARRSLYRTVLYGSPVGECKAGGRSASGGGNPVSLAYSKPVHMDGPCIPLKDIAETAGDSEIL